MSTRNPWPKPAPTLLVLVMLLVSCSAQLPVQTAPPVRPEPPSELMTPPTPGLWSDSARQLFNKWLKLLTPAKDA